MTATRAFSQPVDRRSKRAMARFLADHFRYDTMNSWNQSTSYANNIKVTHVVPDDLVMKAFEVLDAEDGTEFISRLIADFDRAHGYGWQAGINGRSDGCVVLYEGYRKPSDYKSVCTICGQRNCKSVEDGSARCGRCGAEDARVDAELWDIGCWPGRGIDMLDFDEFLEWDIDSLRDRVALVQDFDALCDDIVADFITTCRDYEVVEDVEMVPRRFKRLTR